MKHIDIDLPLFKTGLHYIYNCDYRELEKYCRKHYDCSEEGEFTWLSQADGTTFSLEDDKMAIHRLVWVEKFSMNPYWIGVLIHETTHAIIRILDHKGIPYTSRDNQDETMAYMMDYFISEFIKKFKKKKK